MTSNLDIAKKELAAGKYVCVLCRDSEVIFSSEKRGVRPLLHMLDCGFNAAGASVADKVIGKAAAHFLILLGVKEVYSPVMSVAARKMLEDSGVTATADQYVSHIINNTGDGICPVEEAVGDIEDHRKAVAAVKAKIATLMKP
jgi:hypothetical protein